MTIKNTFNALVSKFVGTSTMGFSTSSKSPNKNTSEYVEQYAGWMYVASDTIATDFAQVDLKLKQVDKKGNEIDDLTNSDSDEMRVLNNPNNAMTRTQLLKLTSIYISIQGRAFWFVIKDNAGNPIGLLPLMPYRVKTILQKDPTSPIKGHVYTTEIGEEVPLMPDEVIYFRDIDPRNPLSGGYASAFAVADDIDTSTYSKEFNKDFFFNGATLSGTLSTDQSLTDDQFKKLVNQWHQRYSGRENSHKTAILQKGLKYDNLGLSHKDMSFTELSKETRDAILSAFKVPKTAVGIVDDVNRANAEATDYVFSKRTINPKQKELVDTLNKFYIPLFKSGSVKKRFEHVDQTPKDTTAKVDQHTRLVASGIETPNEARTDLNLPPLQNGDQVYMPMGFVAVDTVKKQSAITIKSSAIDGEIIKDSKKKASTKKKKTKSKHDSVVTLTAKPLSTSTN